MKPIHCIALNTAIDMKMIVRQFQQGGVFRSESYSELPSGKAVNSARTIACFSLPTTLFCFSGSNDVDMFSNVLPVITSHVVSAEGGTRRNLTLVSQEEGLVCHVQNPGYQVSESKFTDLLKLIVEKIENNDIVIFSGSIPSGITMAQVNQMLLCIKQKGAKIIIDVDSEILKYVDGAGVFLVKPNLDELKRLANCEIADSDIVSTAHEYINSDYIVVSNGGRGAVLIDKKNRRFLSGSTVSAKDYPADEIGCGDSMVGGMAMELAKGHNLEQAFIAGLACGHANLFAEGPGNINIDSYNNALRTATLDSWNEY